MSFQLSTATALPAEVQLGREKPQGAFCLRSRYALSANSASSWNAGTTCSIPLQTGTPGTFTDVKQGIIQATVQIANTNPYVDFVNFGPSGAMILFDEMRIYSSGTPLRRICATRRPRIFLQFKEDTSADRSTSTVVTTGAPTTD